MIALVLPEDPHLIGSLTLLVLPLTLAGSVVLYREPTPLAERLLRRWRKGLVSAIAALWIATVARLLRFADVPAAEALWSAIKTAGCGLVSLVI